MIMSFARPSATRAIEEASEGTLTLMGALNSFNQDFTRSGDKWNRGELAVTVVPMPLISSWILPSPKTVALAPSFFCTIMIDIGLPTMLLRPTTTTSAPSVGVPLRTISSPSASSRPLQGVP